MSTLSPIRVPKLRSSHSEDVAARSFAKIDPDAPIWLQLPDEPISSYSKFQLYLFLGTDRTVLDAFNRFRAKEHGHPPSMTLNKIWRSMAATWRWRERAAAFDRKMAQDKQKAFEREQELSREARIKFLGKFKGEIETAIDAFNPDLTPPRLTEIASAIRVFGQEMRAEMDDEPAAKTEIAITSMADLLRAAQRERLQTKETEVLDAEFSVG